MQTHTHTRCELKRGDAFQLLPKVADGSIDCMITDPPYGTTDCKWDHNIDLAEFWREVWRVLKPAGVAVVFGNQPFTTDVISAARRWFRYELVWAKSIPTGHLDCNRRPLRAHETMLVFMRAPRASTYHPQMMTGKPYTARNGTGSQCYSAYGSTRTNNTGTRHPTSMLKFGSVVRSRESHPTQKPLDLCRWLVRTYSNPNDLVLDPFAGSATTGVACAAEGRHFIGFERDAKIYRAAQRRLKESRSGELVQTLASSSFPRPSRQRKIKP